MAVGENDYHSMINTATEDELTRLLGLFPVEALREAWPKTEGDKDNICRSIAMGRDLPSILEFISQEFLRCRQHVYVYEAPNLGQLPDNILEGEREHIKKGVEALYLARLTHTVFIENPVRKEAVTFLWPIQIRFENGHMVVRFVTLEKNLRVYLGQPYSQGQRSITETAILEELIASNDLGTTNLHAGVKTLWERNFFDAYRVQFKKPNSTTTEVMDEELGIKQHHPKLYEIVKDLELFKTVFKVRSRDGVQQGVSVMHIEPSKGKITFPRYSEKGDGYNGDSGFVVNEIIRLNE